jgi:hypothetical protein
VLEVELFVVGVGLMDRVLQYFGDGVPSTSKLLRMSVRPSGAQGCFESGFCELVRMVGNHGLDLDVDVRVSSVQCINAVGRADFIVGAAL